MLETSPQKLKEQFTQKSLKLYTVHVFLGSIWCKKNIDMYFIALKTAERPGLINANRQTKENRSENVRKNFFCRFIQEYFIHARTDGNQNTTMFSKIQRN